jgi:hypothetical protein
MLVIPLTGVKQMDIPISGIIFSNDSDANSIHSHNFYLMSYDGRPVHRHSFSGITSIHDRHRHSYHGVTQPAPTGVPHTHHYYTVTSFDDGHTHVIRGVTGPAIPLHNGGHYHVFEGYTTVNGMHPHSHSYSGATGHEMY